MIYLNDVDRGNAALRYAAGTHRTNHAFRIAYMRAAGAPESLPDIPAPEERMELADLEGPAGTVILFDSEGFHSAGTLSAGREQIDDSIPQLGAPLARGTLAEALHPIPVQPVSPQAALGSGGTTSDVGPRSGPGLSSDGSKHRFGGLRRRPRRFAAAVHFVPVHVLEERVDVAPRRADWAVGRAAADVLTALIRGRRGVMTAAMRLRPARADDLPAIAAIHVGSWRTAYRGILSDEVIDAAGVEQRLAIWKVWFLEEDVRLQVAESDGEVVGFCRLGPARDTDDPPPRFAEVTHLYVAPGATRGGIGRVLFADAVRHARAAGHDGLLLWVLEENAPARRFYERHGLAVDGARHDEPGWLGEGVYEVRYRIAF